MCAFNKVRNFNVRNFDMRKFNVRKKWLLPIYEYEVFVIFCLAKALTCKMRYDGDINTAQYVEINMPRGAANW